MNQWKVAFFVVLAFGLASNGYLMYLLVDGGISYSYLQDSYAAESKRFKALGELVVAGSGDYTKRDALHLLRQANRDAFIVEENDLVHYEGISFVFERDRLAKVE